MAVLTENPIVGAVTPTEAKINVRTDAAASVVIEYDTNSGFTSPTATGAISTVAGSDFTATFSLSGLTANTRYFYRIKVDGTIQNLGYTPQFDTFPSTGSFSFAVFADVAKNDRVAPAYRNADDDDPLFAFQIGDFDHGNPTTLSAMRQMHRDMRDDSAKHGDDFVDEMSSKRAIVHMWDDHDYGGQDEDRFFAGRSNAWQAFKEYYPTYTLANAANGLWHKFTVVNAEFFVLDLRSQRDAGTDTDNSDKSMLDGALITDDQKDWLKNGLKDSTAKWKFIISSVTFNEDARPNSTDIWHSYSTEAQELLDWLIDESIDDVIVLSGDLHTGGGIDDGTNSLIDVPEMTVPHTNLAGGNSNNLGTWSVGVSDGNPSQGNGRGYGLVTVTANDVKLQAMAQNGNERWALTVN